MLSDIWTVIRNEYLDSFHSGERLETFGVIVVAPLAGVLYSLPWGLGWYSSDHWDELFPSFPTAFPWLMTLGFVLRERSRLGMKALTARRLPRDAILYGMIGAGVGVGVVFWMVMWAVSLVVLNLLQPEGPWASIPILGIPVMFTVEFLITFSAATGGVLVSVGAAKIGQIYKVSFWAVAGLAFVVFAIAWAAAESGATWIGRYSDNRLICNWRSLDVMVFFAVLDLVLILYGKSRFRRAHLSLSL